MTSQTTQIPSITGRLMEMLGGNDKGTQQLAEGMAGAIMGIGGALAVAGVTFGGAANPATLGGLVVDMKLPNMVAAAQGIDNSPSRSYT